MKHLLGAAFVIAVIILIIIGLTSDEQPMPMEPGNMDHSMSSDTMPHQGDMHDSKN